MSDLCKKVFVHGLPHLVWQVTDTSVIFSEIPPMKQFYSIQKSESVMFFFPHSLSKNLVLFSPCLNFFFFFQADVDFLLWLMNGFNDTQISGHAGNTCSSGSTGHQHAFSGLTMKIGPTKIDNCKNYNFQKIKEEEQEEISLTWHTAEILPSK